MNAMETPQRIWIDPHVPELQVFFTTSSEGFVEYARIDPPAAPTDGDQALKKRARQIIDAVIKSPVIVEVRAFSQPEEVDRLEDQVVALLMPVPVAPPAPDECPEPNSDSTQATHSATGDVSA